MSTTPQLLIHIADDKLGFLGYLAIDSFVHDTACGGIRVKIGENAPNGSYAQEAILLSREMTLKFGFHEIPLGGAKSVIILPPDLPLEQRDRYFEVFGRHLKTLLNKNILQVGQDMGMNGRDLYFVAKGSGRGGTDIPPVTQKSLSGQWTALGMMETFKTVCQFDHSAPGALTCGIEGFGAVGLHLAQFLDQDQFKIVAISTVEGALYNPQGLDVRQLVDLRGKYADKLVLHYPDAQKISKDELFTQEMDVLFPCAGLHSINKENISHLQAKIVIAGSNCAADDACAEFLHQRGIRYIPGFVANAASVLKSYITKQGGIKDLQGQERELKRLFAKRVDELLRKSTQSRVSEYQQAVQIAHEHINNFAQRKPSFMRRLKKKIASIIRWSPIC